MLYRAIKYQVDKGPVDSVTGKAKRTLNDSHLLREDIDYSAMVTKATETDVRQRECSLKLSLSVCLSFCLSQTLTVLVKNGDEVQPCPVKVLDIDTITQVTVMTVTGCVSPVNPLLAHLSALCVMQVKDKILDQVYRGAPFSQRPAADSLDLGIGTHSCSHVHQI